MATTRSQAARDAAAEITTERESSTSVASDIQTDNMMAFLQQISHQIEERRARENEKEEQEEREREKEKRDEERFEDLKKTESFYRTDSASCNVTIKKLPEEDKSTYSNNTAVVNSFQRWCC